MNRASESEADKELSKIRDAFNTIGKSTREYGYGYSDSEEKLEKIKNPDTRGILDHCLTKDWDWLRESEHDLNAMNEECQKRYNMITLMDDSNYSWKSQEKSIKATREYITIVEATYNIKKKIENTKASNADLLTKFPENIFLNTNA
tara:strand:- start:2833 stop:3273 length:441 start_codon:yes stop_codon:yes gene_type:complete